MREHAAASGDALVVPCLPHRNASYDTVSQWFRDNSLTSYHYFGTAALGSVVDPSDFSALGVSRLYVADSSVLPKATRANPVLTIMAFGHLAATKVIDSLRGKS